jgi:hypothetical protein
MDDEEVRVALGQLPLPALDDLRRLLIRDQPDRDAKAEQLLRRRTVGANDFDELIDMLSLNDEMRRQVVRILGELEASG